MIFEPTSMAALDFELADLHGQTVRLANYRDHKNVVLVFNRGLM